MSDVGIKGETCKVWMVGWERNSCFLEREVDGHVMFLEYANRNKVDGNIRCMKAVFECPDDHLISKR